LLAAIRIRYQLRSLDAVPRGQRWAVRGLINPAAEALTDAQTEEGPLAPDMQRRWTEGLQALNTLVETSVREPVDEDLFDEAVLRIKQRFGFREIAVTSEAVGETESVVVGITAVMNPQYRIRRARVKKVPLGTQSFPIPFAWYKRPISYGNFVAKSGGVNASFQPRGRRPIDIPVSLQSQWGGATQITLGVNQTYWRGVGDLVHRTPSGSRTIQNRLRVLLQDPLHGLNVSATTSGLQVDHVLDLGFDGVDRLSNLWPISAVANQAASDVYRQRIRMRIQGRQGFRGLVQQSATFGKYFRIRTIR